MSQNNEVSAMAQSLNISESVIYAIIANYNGLTLDKLMQLVNATDKIKGVGIARINDYSSTESKGTEIASYTINIGASYENMKDKDEEIYANVDLSKIDVKELDYTYYLLNDIRVANPNYDSTDKKSKKTMQISFATLADYQQAIKAELVNALAELQQDKKKNNMSANVWINKALVFNTNTNNLSIRGMLMNKSIAEKGTYDYKRSAPLTVAKLLINNQCKSRAHSLRLFNIPNILSNVRMASTEVVLG